MLVLALLLATAFLGVSLLDLLKARARDSGDDEPPRHQEEVYEPILPICQQGDTVRRPEFVLTVNHRPPRDSLCGDDCQERPHWWEKLRVDPASGDGLVSQVGRMDEGVVLIRAPARMPFGVLLSAIGSAGPRGLYRFAIAAMAEGTKADRQFVFTVPHAESYHSSVLFMTLRSNHSANTLERQVTLDFGRSHEVFPYGDPADALLASFLAAWRDKEQGSRANIDVGSDVSLQAVVDLMSTLQRAKFDYFILNTAK